MGSVGKIWPERLTPDLQGILGFMCFELASFAHSYRAAGEFVGSEGDLNSRAEDEQAFMLHKFIGFWQQYGPEWREAAKRDLERVAAIAKVRGQ